MDRPPDCLTCEDKALLAQCDVDTYRSSGPGGQHRNKVSSAVRLRHRATGVMAHGDESRSQHDNRRMAIRRLRMNLACTLRAPLEAEADLPDVLAECLFTPRKVAGAGLKLAVGRKDERFWPVAACLLDLLEAAEGRVSAVAARVGISTGNVVSQIKSDRHLLTAANRIRKEHGAKPLE